MENPVLKQWENGLRINHISHAMAASHYKKYDRSIGIANTILATIVASSIFAAISDSENTILLVVAGIFSVLAAVFNAIYTFLNYGELAEKHRQAWIGYGDLRKTFEAETIFENSNNPDKIKEFLLEFNKKLSDLEKVVPEIPQKIHDRAKQEVLKNKNE
ncbi:SLATT domain-containing protein [Marinigracilibium pacificum]|uniref:SLATT domain-containing protein n=1 Tax=Marinigracilibium pacificum TaxID=2729599 RepID=A0A848J546_9BACT|nr:SLATT domain-containing protein [Marinigracilibium pacificum]NMM50836.1 SLATT domain-containing protein [Marinigracilibium pacificum]